MSDTEKLAVEAREALQRAVFEALDRKRRLGQYAVIVEDDQILHIGPDEIERRIAPLRKQYGQPVVDSKASETAASFEVRETPPKPEDDES